MSDKETTSHYDNLIKKISGVFPDSMETVKAFIAHDPESREARPGGSIYTKQDIFMSFRFAAILAAPVGEDVLELDVMAVEEGDPSIVQQIGCCNWGLAIAGASSPFFALNSEWYHSDAPI